MTIRIILVEELRLVREALAANLPHRGYEVVGQCGSMSEALELLSSQPAHVISLHAAFSRAPDPNFLIDIAKCSSKANVLVTLRAVDEGTLRQLVHSGARGIYLEQSPAALFYEALETVAAGGLWLDPAASLYWAIRDVGISQSAS